MYKIMTPGPVQVRENVMAARREPFTNPDLDIEFYEFYKETCDKLAKILDTDDFVYILGGEGILGLEAACASLTEKGDRVLVLDNGIFGRGFADFVTLYGGNPVLFSSDYHQPIDADALKEFLKKDSDFKYATMVHMDTPTGVKNDVSTLCPILKEYGILTVVDSVAGMFGEKISVKESSIDILCGGSQKALSAPPGLTIVAVSCCAMNAMENRKTPISSFYANLLTFRDYYKDKWFPYTMPASDINGLAVAVDNFLSDKTVFERHARTAAATRKALTDGGLKLYLNSGFSSNVTVICVPDGINDKELLSIMACKYNILIAGCFDILAGKVIRIGHMGENCYPDKVAETLDALEKSLIELNFTPQCSLKEAFEKALK